MQHDDPSSEMGFGARARAPREEIGISLASLAAAVCDATSTAMTAMTAVEFALLETSERLVRLNEAVAHSRLYQMRHRRI